VLRWNVRVSVSLAETNMQNIFRKQYYYFEISHCSRQACIALKYVTFARTPTTTNWGQLSYLAGLQASRSFTIDLPAPLRAACCCLLPTARFLPHRRPVEELILPKRS
jgi:hypothetical protein